MIFTKRLEKEGLSLTSEAQEEINDIVEAVSEVKISKISNRELAEFLDFWEYCDYDEYGDLHITTKRGRQRTLDIKEYLQAAIDLVKEVKAEIELEKHDIYVKY